LQFWAKELIKRNVKVTVFTIHYPFKKTEYDWYGINVVPLNVANNPIKRKFIFGAFKKVFQTQHNREKFDLIQSFWFNEATFFGLKLSKQFSIPIIATATGQDVLSKNKWLRKLDFMQIQKLIFTSDFQLKNWKSKAEFPAEVIHFGIDRMSFDLKQKTIDIVGVGNLIPLKQFDYLLKIIAVIVLDHPTIKVEIIGVGPEKDKLQKQIIVGGLEKNITLCGGLDYDKTIEKIASSKLLIHPSSYESFGMIFIEALALKTPVLASPVGLAFEENSIEKLTFDPQKDAEKALELLHGPIVEQKFYTIESTIDKYMKIYDRF
jgi:glycosyltransferase involved in cell wall biosynthesis